MPARSRRKKFTAADRRSILSIIHRVERQFGAELFRWGIRKHLAIAAAERKAALIRKEMRAKIRELKQIGR